MSYLKKASFAYGELDPSLHDKTDSQSYYAGLKTARNVLVNKTGRVINNSGTWFGIQTKNNTAVRLYAPNFQQDSSGAADYEDFLLEFGNLYVRLLRLVFGSAENRYKLEVLDEEVTTFTTDDLVNLKFESIKEKQTLNSYKVFVSGGWLRDIISISVNSNTLTVTSVQNAYPTLQNDSPNFITYKDLYKTQVNVTAQIGVRVTYGVTVVTKSGMESTILQVDTYQDSTGGVLTFPKLPVNDEFNSFSITNFEIPASTGTLYSSDISHFNIYRRPFTNVTTGRNGYGNGWGLIGIAESTGSYTSGNNITISFADFGQEADYTNPPPTNFRDIVELYNPLNSPIFGAQGIGVYNQRLLIYEKSFIAFSRVTHPTYFLRDFPLTQSTSFLLDIGEGNLTIYHHANYNGLYLFTSKGIFYGGSDSAVSSLNPILRLVNDSVVDATVPPIVTPYGMFFVDSTTKTIKTLMYDDVAKSVISEDISASSDHLFYGKKVVSWAFHGGEVPHLFVVLDDGTAATYSYSKVTGLNAWTPHNTDGNYKQVINYKDTRDNNKYLIYLIERDGNYNIETSSVRALTTPTTIQSLYTIPYTFNELYRAFSHSSVFFYTTNDVAVPGTFVKSSAQGPTIDAVSGTWDTQVKIDDFIGGFWTGKEGVTFAVYVPSTGEYYYMVVATVVAMTSVTFNIIGEAFPVELRSTAPEIIQCHTVITGLSHLNGKKVSVYSDNAVVGSPYNDAEPYDVFTVSGGSITLPSPRAYSVVGLPYVSDIETLEIDTRNGTTALDKKIVNEVGVRYARTRGVYVSGELPANNSVVDMENAQDWTTEDVVNRPIIEKTGLKVYRPTSTWNGKGKIALRQVDPLPFEVTSIILDVSKG